MKSLWLAALLMLAACASAPPDLRARVAQDIKEDMPPVPPAGRLFSRVDISHDGVADWRVDYERSGMGWCGTGGCTQKVFVSRPGGAYILAFEEQTREFSLRRGRKGAVLDIEIHGTNCGLSGVNECRRRFRWDDVQGRFIEQPNRRGDGRLAGPLFQTLPVSDIGLPTVVEVALGELTAACTALGGDYVGGVVSRSPDLDGDGRADWIVGSEYGGCTKPAAEPGGQATQLPGPGLRVVAEDAAIMAVGSPLYAVDVATTPATFISITPAQDCGGYDQQGCMETPYRWDPASGHFVAGRAVRGPSLRLE
ncbi:hypothetical protein BH11PSE1_BH11PSE1_09060 [soil metagenome]